jgi:hypothetical protein
MHAAVQTQVSEAPESPQLRMQSKSVAQSGFSKQLLFSSQQFSASHFTQPVLFEGGHDCGTRIGFSPASGCVPHAGQVGSAVDLQASRLLHAAAAVPPESGAQPTAHAASTSPFSVKGHAPMQANAAPHSGSLVHASCCSAQILDMQAAQSLPA